MIVCGWLHVSSHKAKSLLRKRVHHHEERSRGKIDLDMLMCDSDIYIILCYY